MPVPTTRVPRRLGTHRVAAIALYRALLSQCGRLQIDQEPRDELRNLVRNRFKQARRDQSIPKLKISFDAGYKAVDLVDDAVAGGEESKSRILRLLQDAPHKARQPPSERPLSAGKGPRTVKDVSSDQEAVKPAKHPLFDRPLPLSSLSGKRHVPVLVNANKIPMLRIRKPIPEHLSGFIAHRLKTRQSRHDRKDRLEDELQLAEREDEWDSLVARHLQRDASGKMDSYSDPSWCDEIETELDTVLHQLSVEREKNRLMATKMQGVVDREAALFSKERLERREAQAQQKT